MLIVLLMTENLTTVLKLVTQHVHDDYNTKRLALKLRLVIVIVIPLIFLVIAIYVSIIIQLLEDSASHLDESSSHIGYIKINLGSYTKKKLRLPSSWSGSVPASRTHFTKRSRWNQRAHDIGVLRVWVNSQLIKAQTKISGHSLFNSSQILKYIVKY